MVGVTVTAPGAEPDAGATLSHAASSVAVHVSAPVPATSSVLAAGLAPPAVALNDRLAGVTDSAGPPEQVTGRFMSAASSAPVSARS